MIGSLFQQRSCVLRKPCVIQAFHVWQQARLESAAAQMRFQARLGGKSELEHTFILQRSGVSSANKLVESALHLAFGRNRHPRDASPQRLPIGSGPGERRQQTYMRRMCPHQEKSVCEIGFAVASPVRRASPSCSGASLSQGIFMKARACWKDARMMDVGRTSDRSMHMRTSASRARDRAVTEARGRAFRGSNGFCHATSEARCNSFCLRTHTKLAISVAQMQIFSQRKGRLPALRSQTHTASHISVTDAASACSMVLEKNHVAA